MNCSIETKIMPKSSRPSRERWVDSNPNIVKRNTSGNIICRLVVLCGFLTTLTALHVQLPTVEGAAIPASIRARFPGLRFRLRSDGTSCGEDSYGISISNSNSNNNNIGLDFDPPTDLDSSRSSSSSRSLSFLDRIRNRNRHRRASTDTNPQQQQEGHHPPRQHGIPLAGWILAGFGKGSGIPTVVKTLLRHHPQWLVVAGGVVVYQGQKALRNEAFVRATRFWYKMGPLVVHYKFTRWWLARTHAPLEKRDAVYGMLHEKYAPVAKDVALDLKGLYIKLAQVVSSRPDFVPLPYIQLFVAAQDSVPQWPIEDVVGLIDAALKSQSDLDMGGDDSSESSSSSSSSSSLTSTSSSSSPPPLSFDDVFEDIDAIALGSASIGQCHKARIKGKYARELNLIGSNAGASDRESVEVAVKVMHPGAEQRFEHDFSVFRWLCKVALTGWEPILDELYRQIMSEFDYRREAHSLEVVRNNMIRSPFRNKVRVPKPLKGLCSKELLVMELLDGEKLSDSLESELGDILGADLSKKLLDRKRLELVLGTDKLEALEESANHARNGDGENEIDENDEIESESTTTTTTTNSVVVTEESILGECGLATKLRLLGLYKRAQSTIDMLVDVQGYQMLKDGVFQGDPHPGNILELGNTKKSWYSRGPTSLLGLIDYGQTKVIADEERLGIAKVILALGEVSAADDDATAAATAISPKTERVAHAMRSLGFATQRDDSKVLEQYAELFFDSDEAGQRLYDCPTPQTYFKILTELDPLTKVPDVAVFTARCGFILRGMGSILGKQIKTSQRWSVYAKEALEEAEAERDP